MSKDFKKTLGEDSQKVSGQGRILYLEGVSDPGYFFALLAVQRPADDIHQDVLVKGLDANKGSGAAAVRELLKCASTDPKLAQRVFGINDGDGSAARPEQSAFVASGPLLLWPCYCIENLFQGIGWPPSWGREPVWATDLRAYAPYVAVNRLQREAQATLKKLGIDHFINPSFEQPLKTTESLQKDMRENEHMLAALHEVPQRFETYVSHFLTTLSHSIDEAQVLFNGKWLFKDFVPRRTGYHVKDAEKDWMAHAVHSGGHPEVRGLWRRLTGREP